MVYAPHDALIQAARDGGALVVDPVFTDDGRVIVVTWPDGRGICTASPEVVEGWAQQVNQLRRKLEEAQAALRVFAGA